MTSEKIMVAGCPSLDLDPLRAIGPGDVAESAFTPTGDLPGRLLPANR